MNQEILHIHDSLKSMAEEQQSSQSIKQTPTGNDLPVIGVRMRDVFDLAKAHNLSIVREMLGSDIYELRMIAVSILDFRARSKKLGDAMKLIDLLLEDESELVARPIGTALREV